MKSILHLEHLPEHERHIAALMSRGKIPWKARITDEERICIQFADDLRVAVSESKYSGIWGHLANEGKRHPITGLIMGAMGMIPGSPDHFFMGPWGHGVIEFKTESGRLTDNQKYYRDWCGYQKVPHAVCRSAGEAQSMLREWGALA